MSSTLRSIPICTMAWERDENSFALVSATTLRVFPNSISDLAAFELCISISYRSLITTPSTGSS
jgi:hypothetical protein